MKTLGAVRTLAALGRKGMAARHPQGALPIIGSRRSAVKLTFHPACLLFPQLPKDELKALAADIKANGLRNPVVRYRGQILDGRN